MTVTTQDKLHADRIMFAVRTRNKVALAEEIAFLRETTIQCAMVRAEREFALKLKKVKDGSSGRVKRSR